MQTFVVLGGAGGVLAVLTGIAVIGRGIFRQVSAVEANTEAINHLSGRLDSLAQQNSNHETRLAVLEDRIRRP